MGIDNHELSISDSDRAILMERFDDTIEHSASDSDSLGSCLLHGRAMPDLIDHFVSPLAAGSGDV